MRLVWHIVRKDLRRMRVPLALWAVVLLVKQELGVNLLHGSAVDYQHFDLLQLAITALTGCDVFVNAILVALLVQEDQVVGTRMFWATRPIAGGRLLAAKLTGAALMFGALPIVVSLRWWLVCGYGAAEIARAAWVTLDAQALVVFGALLFATLTENVNRFLLAMLGSWVAVMAWIFLLVRLGDPLSPLGESFPNEWQGLVGTRAALLGTVLVAGFTAAIVLQFRTRRLRRSVALAAAATMLASVILFHGPRSWSRPLIRPAGNSPTAAGITLSVERAYAVSQPWREEQWVALPYLVHGLPEESGISGETWNTWRWLDGSVVGRRSQLDPLGPELGEWLAGGLPREKFQGAIHRSPSLVREGQVLGSPREGGGSVVGVRLSQVQVDRLRREPAAFTGEARLTLTQPTKVSELPLAAGERGSQDGYSVRIATTQWHDDLLIVNLIESRPLLTSFAARRRPGIAALFGAGGDDEDELGYLLVNRTRGEMIKLQYPGVTIAVVGTQLVRWFSVTLQPRATVEGATLNLVRYRTERFWREVNVPQLPVTPVKNPQ